ncbi:MAG: hemerythrin domain-containing protein [Alphaproteobacteria bacterium]|nr:hemerythrin domain-containing protein [Alphaproteobacteria bacterium]
MPAQTKTGALLHREHLATIRSLQNLEAFLVNQTQKRVPDAANETVRAMLDEIIGMVGREVGRHFSFEENHLFPLLAERGESGIGDFLMSEHQTILPLAEDLRDRAQAARDGGFDAASWKAFHGVGLELVEREIFHIQKEEMGLLMAISMLLDPEADAILAVKYEEVLG